jgi:hypothetical protein
MRAFLPAAGRGRSADDGVDATLLLRPFWDGDGNTGIDLERLSCIPWRGAMDTASPRDVARLLQTWGRGEEALPGEHTPPAYGELCGRAPRHIDRDRPGPAPQMTVTARAR